MEVAVCFLYYNYTKYSTLSDHKHWRLLGAFQKCTLAQTNAFVYVDMKVKFVQYKKNKLKQIHKNRRTSNDMLSDTAEVAALLNFIKNTSSSTQAGEFCVLFRNYLYSFVQAKAICL